MALPFPPPPRPDLPPERFELFLPMWFLSLFAHNHRALVRQRVLSGPKHPTCRAGEVNVNILLHLPRPFECCAEFLQTMGYFHLQRFLQEVEARR